MAGHASGEYELRVGTLVTRKVTIKPRRRYQSISALDD
jgi:hypothetical protein